MRGLVALAVIVGVLAFVAGVCYEIGSREFTIGTVKEVSMNG